VPMCRGHHKDFRCSSRQPSQLTSSSPDVFDFLATVADVLSSCTSSNFLVENEHELLYTSFFACSPNSFVFIYLGLFFATLPHRPYVYSKGVIHTSGRVCLDQLHICHDSSSITIENFQPVSSTLRTSAVAGVSTDTSKRDMALR